MSNLMCIFSNATWIEMESIWFKIITRDIIFQQIPMRTFSDFTGYEIIYGIYFTIELRLVIAMREKGHDYRFLSSLVRNIVNGLEDSCRKDCDVSHRDMPDAGVDSTGSAALKDTFGMFWKKGVHPISSGKY